MRDATKLLGEVLEQNASPAAPQRLNAAVNQNGSAGPGLRELVEKLGGKDAANGFDGLVKALEGMDRERLDQVLNETLGRTQQGLDAAKEEVRKNNPIAIGGLGALAGALLGGGNGALGGALLAVLGSIAYAASQNAPTTTAPAGTPADAGPIAGADDEDVQTNALLLVRAMIEAAKVDGRIDPNERARIMQKLDQAGLDADARQYALNRMDGPPDLQGLVTAVKTPAQALQVYTASLLAMDAATPAEKEYLTRLAQALKLPPQAVASIHQALGVPV